MVLVDASVWVDHLRRRDAHLADLLERDVVVMHPFVLGELACGNLSRRPTVLELLRDLRSAAVADHEEVMGFLDRHLLYGKGIGWVDVHLLASTALTPGGKLWTRDKRLQAAANRLGCSEVASH
ncbi:MAG: type II toxin-antitoxin system VapC family toxin [Burkholderiales bacterium]|nr:type II toxin-antitoxin system VapC family toxin [Burkholderiales bacterium]